MKNLCEYKDSDIFLDRIMQFLFKEFGAGEILEYIAIHFLAKPSADDNHVGDLLLSAVDAISPEADDKISFSSNSAFKRFWQVYHENKIAGIEYMREFCAEVDTSIKREVLSDMITVIIAEKYEIEEDIEHLKKKYTI